MVTVVLPDGAKRSFEKSITGLGLADSISKSLSKSAVAITIDGKLKDLNTTITTDSNVSIVTNKDPEYLSILRHSTAHLLAQAAKQVYGDKIQVTIGPDIKDGFYYDFYYKDGSFKPEDLIVLENKMQELVKQSLPIVKKEVTKEQAIEYFTKIGETYKVEIIKDLPEEETITMYEQGDFSDLCRGPHVSNTSKIGFSFKLTKIAGSYWKGDSNNQILQRVYGTVWKSKAELNDYLERVKEAERRDHRKIGKAMDLFLLNDQAAGAVFWQPRGYILYRKLQEYMRSCLEKLDYFEVNTPQIADRSLWEKSGHWEKFQDNMYLTGDENKTLAIKPMSCPGHMIVYNNGVKSYRDMPFKISEFGAVFRKESSGSMHGIMRVKAFTQDDAHIFCSEEQVAQMVKESIDITLDIYKTLGFENVRVKFSDRPEVRAGDDTTWDRAEEALKEATEACGIELEYNKGEGAFYGPKLEFVLVDAIGRDWQCGTVQLDMVLPKRFNATYIDENNNKKTPALIHRAIFGSMERFIGILIENFAGNLPLWLSPLQVAVCSVVSDANDYANEVTEKLTKSGLIVEKDLRNEKINYKIREHSLRKVPVIIALGNKESKKTENKTVSIRRLGSTKQVVLGLDEAIAVLIEEAKGPYNLGLNFRQNEMPRYFTNAI